MARKRVLVTGASGTVGSQVLEQLAGDNRYEVIAFDIKTKRSAKILRNYEDRLKVIYGDITRKDDTADATSGIDAVIHLAAVIPPAADHDHTLARRVNVDGTANIIENLKVNSPGAFMIYASSISVYGDRVETPMIKTCDELTPSKGDYYARTKIEAEEIVRASGPDWTIFRVAAVMGGGNHKIGSLMFEMPLKTSIEIISPGDTARAFVNAIEKSDVLKGQTFDLGGGEKNRISYGDFLDRAFQESGLGHADFPDYAFAEQNFHCGLYADGDKLEAILHFRRDTLEDFFTSMHKSISPVKRFFASIFRKAVKKHLLRLSPPNIAFIKKDRLQLARFFRFRAQR